ncbi:MAG: MEDS domain-containing protein [Angustibacter sp.]
MSPSPTVGAWEGDQFAHEAFVYDSDDAVRRRCVPYVEEGLDLGQTVVLVASRAVREMLLAAFGERLDGRVTMQAAEAAWHGAPATLAAYQESMRPLLEAGEPWRLIGEPVWLAYPGGERWSRYEAVANVAFAH